MARFIKLAKESIVVVVVVVVVVVAVVIVVILLCRSCRRSSASSLPSGRRYLHQGASWPRPLLPIAHPIRDALVLPRGDHAVDLQTVSQGLGDEDPVVQGLRNGRLAREKGKDDDGGFAGRIGRITDSRRQINA